MLKIALLFLFCAISGYGINGLPNNADIPHTEISTVVGVAQSNDKHLNGKIIPSQVLSSNESITLTNVNSADSHKNTIVSHGSSNDSTTVKPQIAENVPTDIPVAKSSPIAADNSLKPVTDNLNVHVITTKSPVTTSIPTSTQKPIPTTTALPVTTTAAPVVPVPAPKPGKWIVNGTNQTCIIVNMAVQFNVSYVDNNNMTISEVLNLPNSNNDTIVTGECGKVEQYIRLSFNDTKNVTNNFTLHFVKNETAKQYSLHHLEMILLIPNNTVVLVHNTSLVSTGLTNSYRCLKQESFTLTQNGTDKIMGNFLISDLQFQAFKTENNTEFGQIKDCKLDVPDAVPIVVGCALSGLVLIVLFAYLMARRRSQARGYSSM